MSSVLALLAALSFALGSVLQQRGTLSTVAPEGDPRFLAEIIRTPVWLAGGACQGAVTKDFVGVVGAGLGPILASWTTYALILSAVGGFALQQSALKTGFLAPSMAASNVTTLLASLVLGVRVFEEVLTRSDHRLVAIAALTLAVGGIAVLASPHSNGLSADDRAGG